MVKYDNYCVLSMLFGVSKSLVSQLVIRGLPLLASHFLSFIPNKIENPRRSSLSSSIVAIIDSTIHATTKPRSLQHLHYNEHYKRHGMITHLLVDFDGYIIAVRTNVLGIVHDANDAQHNNQFKTILNGNYALGDPGFAGVPYVVAGLKTNQINGPGARIFDTISREEQSLYSFKRFTYFVRIYNFWLVQLDEIKIQ